MNPKSLTLTAPLVLLALTFPVSSTAQWMQTSGPYGGVVNCLTVMGTTDTHGNVIVYTYGAFADDHEDRDGIAAIAKERGSRVLNEQPAFQDIHYSRGRAYEHIGRLDLAAADYRRAIQITRRGHVRRQAETRLSMLPNVVQA